MPKEQIVQMNADLNQGSTPGLSVGWTPPRDGFEGAVQIILTADPGYLKYRVKLFEDTVGEGAATKVSSPELGREELNKLIRVLRNARDKAYGRDE